MEIPNFVCAAQIRPDFSEHKIETKLILAKDIGDFNISLNPYLVILSNKPEYLSRVLKA